MNTIFRDLSIIWTLIHCCIMFMFLYESRYPQRKTNILTSIFMILLVIVNMLNVWLLGIEKAGQFIVPACVLPSLIFFFCLAKNRGTRFLFTFCVVDTIVLEVLFITNLLDDFLGLGNYTVMFVLRLILLPLIEFLIVKYLRAPYHLLQQQMKKGWGVFSILAAFFYIIIIWTAYYPTIILERPEYIPLLFLILLLVPVMYITVFKVLWIQLKLFQTTKENQALGMQIKMADERLRSSSEIENHLKMLRHDIKHKLLLLHDYIKTGKIDEAEKYISALIQETSQSTLKTYCENHSMNAVLSYYNRIADENNISFETNISLPEKLPVSEMDLTVILSNGLENSINALACCDYKKITVKGFIDDNKIYLEIKNPVHGAVLFDGNLPKSKGENHGYGTKSMAAIVTKNEGVYCFTLENGYFIFRCNM